MYFVSMLKLVPCSYFYLLSRRLSNDEICSKTRNRRITPVSAVIFIPIPNRSKIYIHVQRWWYIRDIRIPMLTQKSEIFLLSFFINVKYLKKKNKNHKHNCVTAITKNRHSNTVIVIFSLKKFDFLTTTTARLRAILLNGENGLCLL